jgi:predicted transport protein
MVIHIYNYNMMYHKFTKPGEKLQKSVKRRAETNDADINPPSSQEKSRDLGEKVSTFQLNVERGFTSNTTNGGKYGNNNRDTIANRINQRDLVVQSNGNPFLSQNNYINDLMNQEKYIRQNNNLNTNY